MNVIISSNGTSGPPGPTGSTGPAGPTGPGMLAGTGTPSDLIGVNGDLYLDNTSPNSPVYWGPKAAGTWVGHGPFTFSAVGGSVGGDLSGTLPNPTVAKVNGTAVAANTAAGRSLVTTGATTSAWYGSLTGHWVFNVFTYAAVADGKQVHDGAMTTGSAILTSATASFVVGDVGKVIMVKNAGTVNSTTLITTIASYQSATQVTLTLTNASGSNLTNLQVLWGTDDTAAINAAVSAAFTHAQSTGGMVKVFFPVPVNPNGFYAIGGALLHTASGNAQIPIPLQSTASNKITLIFEGAGNGSGFQHWQETVVQTGVTLVSFGLYASAGAQSTDINANGNPSVIGGPTPPNGYGISPGVFTNVLPVLRNISIRNAHNANGYGWTAFDFYGCAEANVENVMIGSTGNVVDGDFGNPSTFGSGSSIGMLMPAPGNNDNSRCQNLAVQGGYTFGMFVPEHFVSDRISILYCWAGVCPVGTYAGSVGSTHAINLGQASIEACANTLCVIGSGSGGQGPWVYGILDVEGTITFIDRFGTSGNGLAALLGEVQLVGIFTPTAVSVQSPTGLRIINGAQGIPTRVITTGTTTLNEMDRTLQVDASGGNVIVNLISAAWTGNVFSFVRLDATGNTVTVTSNGIELIHVAGGAAATTTLIAGQYTKLNLSPARVGGIWGWYNS